MLLLLIMIRMTPLKARIQFVVVSVRTVRGFFLHGVGDVVYDEGMYGSYELYMNDDRADTGTL